MKRGKAFLTIIALMVCVITTAVSGGQATDVRGGQHPVKRKIKVKAGGLLNQYFRKVQGLSAAPSTERPGAEALRAEDTPRLEMLQGEYFLDRDGEEEYATYSATHDYFKSQQLRVKLDTDDPQARLPIDLGRNSLPKKE
jgi:hypothetical protein